MEGLDTEKNYRGQGGIYDKFVNECMTWIPEKMYRNFWKMKPITQKGKLCPNKNTIDGGIFFPLTFVTLPINVRSVINYYDKANDLIHFQHSLACLISW